MNYNELSKDELLAICSIKKVPHNSNWEKDKLVKELEEFDKVERQKKLEERKHLEKSTREKFETEKVNNKKAKDKKINSIGPIGIVGVILGIIISTSFATTMIVLAIESLAIGAVGLFFIFGFVTTFFIINIVSISMYLRGSMNKIWTGVLSIIFGGVFSGILILIDPGKEPVEVIIKNKK